MFLLCGYKADIGEEYPDVLIIGLYKSLVEAEHAQEINCGKLKKLPSSCWQGWNGITTWIKSIDIGTLDYSIDIRSPVLY
mgnify:FL=1|jgi:hypothetical protein